MRLGGYVRRTTATRCSVCPCYQWRANLTHTPHRSLIYGWLCGVGLYSIKGGAKRALSVARLTSAPLRVTPLDNPPAVLNTGIEDSSTPTAVFNTEAEVVSVTQYWRRSVPNEIPAFAGMTEKSTERRGRCGSAILALAPVQTGDINAVEAVSNSQ